LRTADDVATRTVFRTSIMSMPFWVDEIAMLDRVDAGRGRPLDSLRAMGMRVGSFSGGVGFLHRGLHLRHGEPRIADVSTAGQATAARDELDVVSPGLELPGKPTGREVQAMHRLQILTDRYIAEGLTPAAARARAREELR